MTQQQSDRLDGAVETLVDLRDELMRDARNASGDVEEHRTRLNERDAGRIDGAVAALERASR